VVNSEELDDDDISHSDGVRSETETKDFRRHVHIHVKFLLKYYSEKIVGYQNVFIKNSYY